MKATKVILHGILMLLADNEHTSASLVGLKQRDKNRKDAIYKLMDLLGYSEEQVEDFYWEWVNENED